MSDWRSELKSSGYYYYDHRNDNCWYLISYFFDDIMKIRPTTLINLRIPNSVYLLIINDLAYLAINDHSINTSKEYGRYLLTFMEHSRKEYRRKYSFDYKAYTDDLIERKQSIEDAQKAERIRLRKEKEERKKILRRYILENSSSNNIIMSNIRVLQKYAITKNEAREIVDELNLKEREKKRQEQLKEREKKKQEQLKFKQERFNQILQKFISEAKNNNFIDPKVFAIQNNYDFNEVLKIAKLSELIGLTEIIDEKRTKENVSKISEAS